VAREGILTPTLPALKALFSLYPKNLLSDASKNENQFRARYYQILQLVRKSINRRPYKNHGYIQQIKITKPTFANINQNCRNQIFRNITLSKKYLLC